MAYKINQHRRKFLKVGIVGSAALTVAACGVSLNRKSNNQADDFLWLQKEDKELLHAIIPVILDGALPDNHSEKKLATDEVISGFDLTIAHFPPTVRNEIRQLLWILELRITRTLLAGIWSPWHKTNVEDISNFLTSWQHADLDLLRVGYIALHDLISAAWYANPRSWQRIGYPGPTAIV